MIYFGVHLLQGERGLLPYFSLQNSLTQLHKDHEQAAARVEEAEDKVVRLRPATFDFDYAEELAREEAGLIRADETVVILE